MNTAVIRESWIQRPGRLTAHEMNDTQRGIRRRRSAAGFSVVEVLVAISLLIVGIVAILELFPPGFSAINHTKNVTLAAQVAASYFQDLKQENFDQIGVIASQTSPMNDDVDPAFNLYDNATPVADHNINSERIIGGEVTRVPQNLYTVTNAATYAVDFGPIDLTAGAAPQLSLLTARHGRARQVLPSKAQAIAQMESSRRSRISRPRCCETTNRNI